MARPDAGTSTNTGTTVDLDRDEKSLVIGQNDAVTGTESVSSLPDGDIWVNLPLIIGAATALSLEIVSDDAADTNQIWAIFGLDEEGNETSVTVSTHATDATIPVSIPGSWYRPGVMLLVVKPSAASEPGVDPAGTVDVQIAGGGAVVTRALPGTGRSSNSNYTAPADLDAFIQWWHVNTGRGDDVIFTVWVRPYGETNAGEDRAWMKNITLRAVAGAEELSLIQGNLHFKAVENLSPLMDMAITVTNNGGGVALAESIMKIIESPS